MNREIKFRVWDKKYKRYMFFNIRECIEDMYLFNGCFDSFKDIVIQQYAGLKDKNGKEIYEGDIARDGVGRYYFCLWDLDRFIYIHTRKDFSILVSDLKHNTHMPIIGNIFENPELLK